jgi:hypothetical protein
MAHMDCISMGDMYGVREIRFQVRARAPDLVFTSSGDNDETLCVNKGVIARKSSFFLESTTRMNTHEQVGAVHRFRQGQTCFLRVRLVTPGLTPCPSTYQFKKVFSTLPFRRIVGITSHLIALRYHRRSEFDQKAALKAPLSTLEQIYGDFYDFRSTFGDFCDFRSMLANFDLQIGRSSSWVSKC